MDKQQLKFTFIFAVLLIISQRIITSIRSPQGNGSFIDDLFFFGFGVLIAVLAVKEHKINNYFKLFVIFILLLCMPFLDRIYETIVIAAIDSGWGAFVLLAAIIICYIIYYWRKAKKRATSINNDNYIRLSNLSFGVCFGVLRI
jgi:uncharacterized membrane protein